MKEDTSASDSKEEISDDDHGIKSRLMFFQQRILAMLNSKKTVNVKRFLLNPKKWGLRKRFLFTTGLFLFAGIISLGFFIVLTLEKNMENSVHEQLTLLEHWVKDELETQKNLLSVSVAFVATLPEITKAISNQDREKLKDFILPYMERIRMTSTNSSIYFHFHLPSLVLSANNI